jgi:hypothetical protein
MAKYEVSFIAPVLASKTILVEAESEDDAYNVAFSMVEEPYYQDLKVWDLEFDDCIQCDGIAEI